LDGQAIVHGNGAGLAAAVSDIDDGLNQFGQALAICCHGGNDGHAQVFLQVGRIDLPATTPDLVHEIEGDDHTVGQLQDLQGQVEIALEAGSVDNVDDYIGFAKEDIVPGDNLLG